MQSQKTNYQIIALTQKLVAGQYKNKHALQGKIHNLEKKLRNEIRKESTFNFLAI